MTLLPVNLDEYYPPETAPYRWDTTNFSGLLRRYHKLHALMVADFKCECCGAGERLTIHHVAHPKGRISPRKVLCVSCHLRVHGKAE